MDDELLQDFLVEAGELIEGIDVQLVALESAPDDTSILNQIFRAFHTIKGGAGFLGLEPLVAVCHRAEDVLNLFRNGQRRLEADSTDLILQSVDEVKRMFDQVGAGDELQPAPMTLLAALEKLLDPVSSGAEDSEQTSVDDVVMSGASVPSGSIDLEDDFDDLIDAIRAGAAAESSTEGELASTHGGGSIAENDLARRSATDMPCVAPDAEHGKHAVAHVELDAEHREHAVARVEPSAADRTHDGTTNLKSRGAVQGGASRAPEQSLRVDAVRVDGVMNLVGELVLVRNRLTALRGRVQDEELNQTLSRLELVSSDLQASVMRLRMQPVGKAFGRFPRVARDLARQLGKEVVLEMHGESTELDKGMVENLVDPLVHLVRNAVDHGIETPDDRERAGKPRAGRLMLEAHQEGSHIFVTVSDDGAGLDADAIKRKAADKGLIDSRTALQMSDADALQLVFMPGFSTKAQVSDISGRGVGMDVVKSQINRVNGAVDIQSDKGAGTKISIRLPLTLAILPALMVVVAGQRLALPLPMIEEIVDFDPDACSTMDGDEVVSLRGSVMPLLDLERWVGISTRMRRPDQCAAQGNGGASFVVIVNTGERRIGMMVHQLIGQEDVIIKPLGPRLQALPGLSGATITGDGGIALIIDPGSLHASWKRLAVYRTSRSAA